LVGLIELEVFVVHASASGRSLRFALISVAVAATSLAAGAVTGSAVIGPAMSTDGSGAQAPRWAASSEPLTVEKPNPFPYRTPTPNFGNVAPPANAAAARAKARARASARAMRHISRPVRDFSRYANEDSFASAPSVRSAPRDRHSLF
jgi:hypothetical protein